MSGSQCISPDFLNSWLASGAILEVRPGVLALAYGEGQWRSCASQAESGADFFAPDFFLKNPKPWLFFSNRTEVSREGLASALQAWLNQGSVLNRQVEWPRWDAADEDAFKSDLEDLLGRFGRGELQKAVPVTFETASGSPGVRERAEALFSLLNRAEGSRIYGFWMNLEHGDEGLLGATPELLFQVDGQGDLETMALAGTVPRSEGWNALWNSEKDQREHAHVIADIRERIGGLGQFSVGNTHICELPTLYHLRTRITLRTEACVPFEDWVELLHPTAALGGYPREASARWLEERNRGIDRGRFGAPFGVRFADGSGVCLVGIRCIQWDGGRTRLGSGCGVVQGSELQREWRELAYKRLSVKRQLGLDGGLETS